MNEPKEENDGFEPGDYRRFSYRGASGFAAAELHIMKRYEGKIQKWEARIANGTLKAMPQQEMELVDFVRGIVENRNKREPEDIPLRFVYLPENRPTFLYIPDKSHR